MTVFDPSVTRAAWRFPLAHFGPVAFAALIYAPLFALQSVWSAQSAIGAPGAAPLAILAAFAALGVFVVSLSSWGRLAFGQGAAGFFSHQLGADEKRLAVAALLLLVLTFTVVGTAFLALAFMLAALALINVDPDAPAPEGGIDIFALLGPSEMTVAVIVIAAFALFSFWFFLRLALAYPSTLALGRIQVLSAWTLSGRKRSIEMLTTLLAVCAPGIAILVAFNVLSAALLGAWPGYASSAVTDRALSVDPLTFGLVCLVYGAVKVAVLGAPAANALCRLYMKYQSDTA